jgi:hypothetical protein
MSAQSEVATVSRALRALRSELRTMGPSADLDARMERGLQAWRAERARAASRRRVSLSLIAAGTVALVVGLGWRAAQELAREPPATAHGREISLPEPADRPEPSSTYPARDAAVLRVRASLGAQLPQRDLRALPGERHYWVDIGISGDGALYVERVTPVDEEFVP